MEENLNNNELNNNQLPNNDYYEPKKNGVKILLIAIIVLLLVGIGLLSYKVFVLDKKKDNLKEDNKVEEKTYDKINYEVKEENGFKYLYVNDKKIEETVAEEELSVEQFKDILIVKERKPGLYNDILFVNKSGEVFEQQAYENYTKGNYKIEGNSILVSYSYKSTMNDWYCNVSDTSVKASFDVKYEYLDSKLLGGVIVNEKTIAEVYKKELETCGSNETSGGYDSIANYIKINSSSLRELTGASSIETDSIEKTKCDGSSFKITNNGLNAEAKCIKSREDGLGIEYTYDITAKNNKTIKISRGCYSCGCSNLYSNSNYIINYYGGCSANGQSIEIYNINDGKEIYYDNYYNDGSVVKPYLATSSRESDDSEDFNNHGIIFNNNKLYYVLADSYDQTKCRLMMADLSSDKFVETEIDSMDCYYRSGSF